MQPANNIVVGVDIGGSHITAALIDLQDHSIIRDSLTRHPVNAKGAADQIVKEWTDAIKGCKSHYSGWSNKMGIAMPGPFDYEKGISLINGLDKYESLYNLNIKVLLAEKLGLEEGDIFLMNDASCFLKGELFCGAAKDCNNVISITLGTGLGSARFADGIIYEGDIYCTPYKDGTTEDYLSTRWFIKEYQKLTGTRLKNVKEVSERAQFDETAVFLFSEFGKNLGEVLTSYITRHNAGTVVIGGNIINAWELFMPGAKKVLDNYAVNVLITKALLGEEAALLGAGSLCLQC